MNNRDTNSLKRVIKETITSYKIESFIVLVLIMYLVSPMYMEACF